MENPLLIDKEKEVTFLLQAGEIMSVEKLCCLMTDIPHVYCTYENLDTLEKSDDCLFFVPVGSVEFVKKFCFLNEIILPGNISYMGVDTLVKRFIRSTTFDRADPSSFVKPKQLKLFIGGIKATLKKNIPEDTEVWESPAVPFESEFRFYIQDLIPEPKILGWVRYDDLDVTNPDPDIEFVKDVADYLHKYYGIAAYTIDIGWRADLQEWDVVELNDAWALGYYNNSDSQSKAPRRIDYAEMLVSRWRQILFNNLINEGSAEYQSLRCAAMPATAPPPSRASMTPTY